MHLLTDLSIERRIPSWKEAAPIWLAGGDRIRITVLGLGDVGTQLAIGLTLLGGDVIEEIGLYDLNENQCRRLEMELGQIAPPPGGGRVPRIRVLTERELFDGQAFFFCATRSVPALGREGTDVRMAQYEANSRIVSLYAAQAAREGYRGLFGVVSDPVDLLCMSALRAGRDEDGGGLVPSQIQGFGLGVMAARAGYYARQAGISDFGQEGRAFGPHGRDLVVANSLMAYDDALSRSLTEKAVSANLEVRSLGYKPFIAPAMSSGALSILALIRGEYHYGAGYLNGLFFGALSRMTPEGRRWELIPLPDALYERLEEAYRSLERILWKD